MNAVLPLTPAEIHLWLAFYDEITNERLLSDYRALLNQEEKEQQSRFYFARDRQGYLVTRALVRTVLSRYALIDPREWVFSTNAYGCPARSLQRAHVCGQRVGGSPGCAIDF
jgi:4'-phosphopantetheinyl transferase